MGLALYKKIHKGSRSVQDRFKIKKGILNRTLARILRLQTLAVQDGSRSNPTFIEKKN